MLGPSARKTQRLQSKSLKGSEIQSKSLNVLGTGTNLEAPFGLELLPPVFTQGHSEDVGFLYSSIHIQNQPVWSFLQVSDGRLLIVSRRATG